MSIRRKLHAVSRQPGALLLLLALLCAACSHYDYDTPDDTPDAPALPTEKYININIVVSSGNENVTRAPLGGEDGDGREDGTQRENLVTGITLIFYQDPDGKGLDTTSDKAQIKIIKHYPVSRTTDATDEKRDEAFYSTGEQPIGSDFDLNATYHVIAVANWDLTQEDAFQVGQPIKGMRDHLADVIYTGSGIGIDATNFVMSLEKDYTINFSTITPETNGNKIVYKIEEGIHIERLAARVDFWMKGATYDETNEGYAYSVYKTDGTKSNDKFVLTAVTPFNLSADDEYLFKRITTDDEKTDWKEGPLIYYLADEKVTNTSNPELLNFVLDPHTTSKTGMPDGYMMADYTLDNFLKTSGSTYESKKISLSNCREGEQMSSIEASDNIIICYPKENTLWKSSSLYYYATGLCIEGYYYKSGADNPEKLIYYGFLRHQGEQSSGSYKIYTSEELKDEDNLLQGSFPMNFGVVRNNIYRVSIDKITERGDEPEKPEITWRIMVKNWDRFEHKTIFM